MSAAEQVEFNDPKAWGFCQFCAYDVPLSMETGDMLPHMKSRMVSLPNGMYPSFVYDQCWGTYLTPTKAPQPDGVQPKTIDDVYLGGADAADVEE